MSWRPMADASSVLVVLGFRSEPSGTCTIWYVPSTSQPDGEPSPSSARALLLDAVIAHLGQHGLGDLSLRQLAPAVGTSHRMLIYHFGSKEGLLIAVVQAVEARQRAALVGFDLASPDRPRRPRAQSVGPVGGPGPGAAGAPVLRALRPGPRRPPGLRSLPRRHRGLVDRAGRRARSSDSAWPRPRPATRPGSAWPSPGDCCSTCWPPATVRGSTGPWTAISPACRHPGSTRPATPSRKSQGSPSRRARRAATDRPTAAARPRPRPRST